MKTEIDYDSLMNDTQFVKNLFINSQLETENKEDDLQKLVKETEEKINKCLSCKHYRYFQLHHKECLVSYFDRIECINYNRYEPIV